MSLFAAVLLGTFMVSAQDSKPDTAKSAAGTPLFLVPVEAARKENPVKATAESLTRGKKQYSYDCAMCHGKDGAAKGRSRST